MRKFQAVLEVLKIFVQEGDVHHSSTDEGLNYNDLVSMFDIPCFSSKDLKQQSIGKTVDEREKRQAWIAHD